MPSSARKSESRSFVQGWLHRIVAFVLVPVALLGLGSVNVQADDGVPNVVLIFIDDKSER